jgi:hypothetical protein
VKKKGTQAQKQAKLSTLFCLGSLTISFIYNLLLYPPPTTLFFGTRAAGGGYLR